MKWLEEEIETRGKILDGNILKVNSFLNHQLDVDLLDKITLLWFDYFKRFKPNKILTIEASGIALATLLAQRFHCPAVFAKKGEHSNMGNVYSSEVYSYTKKQSQKISVDQEFLSSSDVVLIVDDFLANGSATNALLEICKKAGCQVVGVGIVIEKGFQDGGKKLREAGVNLYSLEIIESMDSKSGKIEFRK